MTRFNSLARQIPLTASAAIVAAIVAATLLATASDQTGPAFSAIALAVCVAFLGYFIARFVQQARDQHEAAKSVTSDRMRIAARRYQESGWGSQSSSFEKVLEGLQAKVPEVRKPPVVSA